MSKRSSCLWSLAWLLIGLIGGTIIGVLIGWFVWPVNYVDTDIVDLRAGYQDDYILMVSDAYLLDGNLAQAERRLSYLSEPRVEQRVVALIQSKMAAGEPPEKLRSLVNLAQGLRVDTREMAQYILMSTPTVTSTATPVPTASPTERATPTLAATDTPVPTQAPTRAATLTLTPTVAPGPLIDWGALNPTPTFTSTGTVEPTGEASPSPAAPEATVTPRKDFTIVSQRMLHKAQTGGCEAPSVIYIKTIDPAGKPVDGIIFRVFWDGGEFPPVVTGSKGPGTAEAAAWTGDYYVEVMGNVNGEKMTGERSRMLRTSYPPVDDLLAAGYCEGISRAECERLRDNNELCTGHYSYELVFRRQW